MAPVVDQAVALLDDPIRGLESPTKVMVRVSDEDLAIPYRVYMPEPDRSVYQDLLPEVRTVLHAVLTRHHDGHVRERHLGQVVGVGEEWVAPFVIQLLGEYVIEIHERILDSLPDVLAASEKASASYQRFVVANGKFLDLTDSRIASYWNCYYRGTYLRRRPSGSLVPLYPSDYPASKVMAIVRHLGS